MSLKLNRVCFAVSQEVLRNTGAVALSQAKVDNASYDDKMHTVHVFSKPRFSGGDDERKSGETFAGLIPSEAILSQIDFSNGCPWAEACESELVAFIDEDMATADDKEDDALGKAFGDMIDKCKGPNKGPDYENAYKEIQKIFQAVTSSEEGAPEMAPEPTSTPWAPESSGVSSISLVTGTLGLVAVAAVI